MEIPLKTLVPMLTGRISEKMFKYEKDSHLLFTVSEYRRRFQKQPYGAIEDACLKLKFDF